MLAFATIVLAPASGSESIRAGMGAPDQMIVSAAMLFTNAFIS